MWKPMLAGTVALALAGTGPALAQQPPQPPAPATPQATPSAPAKTAPTSPSVPKATPQEPGASKQPSAEEREAARQREELAEDQARLEGRIAALKVRLMLTEDQAKNWPAFEKAYRDFAKTRMEQWDKFRDRKRSDNPLENMEARAEFAISRGTAMKEFATAAMPLYNSLDPRQQRQLRKAAFRGLMMMRHHGQGPRWGDRDDDRPRWRGRDDDGPRWRDRGDSERGYGPRWGGRGGDDGGCDGGRQGWHHRGGGMMGERDDMMGRRGGMMGDRDDMMGRRGGGMMGERWSCRNRDDDDRRAGPTDDDDNGSGSNSDNSNSSRPLGPDEERF